MAEEGPTMSTFANRRQALGVSAAVASGFILDDMPPAAAAPIRSTRQPSGRVSPTQPVALTKSGLVRGFTGNGVDVFRGIPYGASTAGANRFLPPQPPQPWQGVRDTLVYGQMCPWTPGDTPEQLDPFTQQDSFLLYRNWTPHILGEDCLRLNVWRPSGNGRRPVMVFMHGGGLASGSGNEILAYDGENLARNGDVVVVTHNHRLNIFGYLDLSSFGGKWKNSVNLGMQDIVAVLLWVRDNIERFGGDPGNVTIFGQSGGGHKVQCLMFMPSAKGLFHKAIIQSGLFLGYGTSIPPDEARSLSLAVLGDVGIGAQSLDGLSSLSAVQLSRAALKRDWKVVTDGTLVPSQTGYKDLPAAAQGIPLIVGTNLNEIPNPSDNPEPETFGDIELSADVTKRYGDAASAIIAAYRAEYPGLRPYEIKCAIDAYRARSPAFTMADSKYAMDGKSWHYLFAWRTPMLGGTIGCFHAAELAFVFDNAGLCVNQTGGGPDALGVGASMSGAWVAFAHKGDPNHTALPNWPAFDNRHPTMIFDSHCVVKNDPEKTGRALVEQAVVKKA